MNTTTVGPVEKTVRDRLADFRDERELNNYNEALKALLNEDEPRQEQKGVITRR